MKSDSNSEYHGDTVRRSVEWLNSDEGEAFIGAYANEAGLPEYV